MEALLLNIFICISLATGLSMTYRILNKEDVLPSTQQIAVTLIILEISLVIQTIKVLV